MPLDVTPSTWQSVTLDSELTALHQAVDEARRHNWRQADVIEPEFENFLNALTRSRDLSFGTVDDTPVARRNSWRAVLEQHA